MTVRVSHETRYLPGGRTLAVQRIPARAAFGLEAQPPIALDTVEASIVAWLRRALPKAIVARACKINEFDFEQKARLLRAGASPAFPTLIIMAPESRAILFEVRTQAMALSGEQKNMHAELRRLGFLVADVRGVDEARQALAAFGVDICESST
jgi:hypothetical protein